MRIVSQDGCWDFPYSKVGIHMQEWNGTWAVHAFGIDGDDECAWKMAEYEDEVTARYACQLMRVRADKISDTFDQDCFYFPQDGEELRNDAAEWHKMVLAKMQGKGKGDDER